MYIDVLVTAVISAILVCFICVHLWMHCQDGLLAIHSTGCYLVTLTALMCFTNKGVVIIYLMESFMDFFFMHKWVSL